MGLYMLLRRKTAGPGVHGWLRAASDAAMVPGAVFTALGALALLGVHGLFDGIGYSVMSFLTSIRGEQRKYASYYDYLNREKKRRGQMPLLMTGLCFFLLAFLLAWIFSLV